jgi:hypothetical protein
MVFLNVALLGLVVGTLLGGSITRLAETPIAAKGLAFVAIGLQLAAFPTNVLPWSTPTDVARVLWLVSFALLVVMLVLNRALRGAAIIAGGLACNLVAVVSNHGLMPVLPRALRAAGNHYQVHNNSIDVVRPNLSLLVDRWATPHWLPFGNVFSVGDVLIAVGTVVAIAAAMRAPARTEGSGDDGSRTAGRVHLGRRAERVAGSHAVSSASN